MKSRLRRRYRYNSGQFSLNTKLLISYQTEKTGSDSPEESDDTVGRVMDSVWWACAYFHAYQKEFDNGTNIDTEIPFEIQPPWGHKKICFVKCPACNKVFVCLSHRFKYCPNCIDEHKRDLQRIRRGARKCEHCGKPLPKNTTKRRKFCPGGACRIAAFRSRKND